MGKRRAEEDLQPYTNAKHVAVSVFEGDFTWESNSRHLCNALIDLYVYCIGSVVVDSYIAYGLSDAGSP